MPADQVVANEIVEKLKSQGLFDRFRKQCLADIDTRPSYRNLMLRVESHVNKFLESQRWSPNLDEFQLREKLRRNISNTDVLTAGVEWIVDQVISPKIESEFKPPIDKVVCEVLGVSHSKWLENRSPEKQQRQLKDKKSSRSHSSDLYSPPGNSNIHKMESPRAGGLASSVSSSTANPFPPATSLHAGHLHPPGPHTGPPPPIPPFSNFPPPPPPPQGFSAPPPTGFPPGMPPYLPPNFMPNHSGFIAPPPPPPPIVMPPLPPDDIPPPPPDEEFFPPPPPPPEEDMEEDILDGAVIEEEVTEESYIDGDISGYSVDISLPVNKDVMDIEETEIDVCKESNLTTVPGKRHLIWEGVQLDLDDISDISVSSVHTSDLSEVDQIAAAMSPSSSKGRRGRKRSSHSNSPTKSKQKTKSSDIFQSRERKSYKDREMKSNRDYKPSPNKSSNRPRQLYDDAVKSRHRNSTNHKRPSHGRSMSRTNRKSYRSSSEESQRSSSVFSGFSSSSISSSCTQKSRRRIRNSASRRETDAAMSRPRRRTKLSPQSSELILSPLKRGESHKTLPPAHSRHQVERSHRESSVHAAQVCHETLPVTSTNLISPPNNSAAAPDEKEIRRQQIQQRLQEIAAQQKLLQLQQEKEQQRHQLMSPDTQDSQDEPSTVIESIPIQRVRESSVEEMTQSKHSNSEIEEGELSDSESNSVGSHSRRPSSSSLKLRSSSRDTPSLNKSKPLFDKKSNPVRSKRSASTGGSETLRRYSARSSPHSGRISSRSRSSSRSSESSRNRLRIYR